MRHNSKRLLAWKTLTVPHLIIAKSHAPLQPKGRLSPTFYFRLRSAFWSLCGSRDDEKENFSPILLGGGKTLRVSLRAAEKEEEGAKGLSWYTFRAEGEISGCSRHRLCPFLEYLQCPLDSEEEFSRRKSHRWRHVFPQQTRKKWRHTKLIGKLFPFHLMMPYTHFNFFLHCLISTLETQQVSFWVSEVHKRNKIKFSVICLVHASKQRRRRHFKKRIHNDRQEGWRKWRAENSPSSLCLCLLLPFPILLVLLSRIIPGKKFMPRY